jgi:cell wall-associated NlpC family hydrolase
MGLRVATTGGTHMGLSGRGSLNRTSRVSKTVGIVTDVERPPSHSAPRSDRSGRLLRRVLLPVMTVVTVCSSTVVLVSRPVGADSISDAKAKAAQIESELSSAQSQMSALSQQYDAARGKLSQVDADITTTKAAIAVKLHEVNKDKSVLEKAAIANYVSNGSAAGENPIFSNDEKTLGAANEYNDIASGDINQAVANLHSAENKLSAQEAQLTAQQGQAQDAVTTEQAAVNQNAQVVQQQSNALAQENGEVATLVAQQQAAQAAQEAKATASALAAAQQAPAAPSGSGGGGGGGSASTGTGGGGGNGGGGNSGGGGGGGSVSSPAAADPPPVAAGASGAIAAAESQLGVPYVFGGETPGVGFDCSGLVQWAWAQAGVDLPRTSGEQMGATTPVSVADLEPGDLLFYGPGGSDHVAMYIGGGSMIEAPHTGAVVWITAIRLDTQYDDFVGAGRP